MARDDSGNIAVDFVWGNFAPQPDTDRAGDGSATVISPANADGDYAWGPVLKFESDKLDATQGFHDRLVNAYNGFPDYTPVAPYLDTVANVVVPNVVGGTESDANTALTGVGLVKGTVTTADNAAGATEANSGKIKSQAIAAGTTVNVGTAVNLVKYAYTPVVPAAPTGVVITPSALSMSIAFVPGYDGGADVTEFQYSFNGTDWFSTEPVTTASPMILAVPAGEYSISLRAVNSVGNGAASEAVAVTVPAE